MGGMSSEYALESIEVSSSPRERFVEYLQSKGKRVTQQRLQLVDHIFQRHDHFDADELILGVAQLKGRKVSRATIYRTLEELVDSGLLFTMDLAGRRVYDHDYGYPQHDHLYCKMCEKLIEFQIDKLPGICEAVGRENGFQVGGHRLLVTGICGDCSRKQNRPPSPLDLV